MSKIPKLTKAWERMTCLLRAPGKELPEKSAYEDTAAGVQS